MNKNKDTDDDDQHSTRSSSQDKENQFKIFHFLYTTLSHKTAILHSNNNPTPPLIVTRCCKLCSMRKKGIEFQTHEWSFHSFCSFSLPFRSVGSSSMANSRPVSSPPTPSSSPLNQSLSLKLLIEETKPLVFTTATKGKEFRFGWNLEQ